MKFISTSIAGLFVLELEPFIDERGFFARTYCKDEFTAMGLSHDFVQCSVSHNVHRGTLRGMHFQAEPHQEAKLVRATAGIMYDVVLDLRLNSPSYMQSFALELSAQNGLALYVPEGCAHGFQTLTDDTDVLYQISTKYNPDFSRGVRWNDPAFGLKWPILSPILSPRDAAFEDWRPAESHVSRDHGAANNSAA
jgi:dTDP-4-dehydrorhamnose 3,5-epimerase